MEKDEDENFVKTFDSFYTNNHIQIMKSLLPYLGSKARDTFPVIIKYLELQDTIRKMKSGCNPLNNMCQTAEINLNDLTSIYQAVKPYLSPDEEQACMQIIQFKSQIDNIKQMQEMISLFQEFQSTEQTESCCEESNQEIDFMKLMQFMKDLS